jgi:hypothetical protein
MSNNLLAELSTKAIIILKNKFEGFHAAPEITKWQLKAEHCSHRGHFFEGEEQDLAILIRHAIASMEEIEQKYQDAKSLMKRIHPEKGTYDIAEMARGIIENE